MVAKYVFKHENEINQILKWFDKVSSHQGFTKDIDFIFYLTFIKFMV